MSEERYWAADDTEEFAAGVFERIDAYYEHIESIGLLDLWRASNKACYSGFWTGGELGRVGKSGEFTTVAVNDYGNLHQHLFTTITGQRPNFEARATVSDAKAQEQAPLAVSVIETAMREKNLEDVALNVADIMLRAGEAFAVKRWDTSAGPVYTSEAVVGEDGMPETEEAVDPDTGMTVQAPKLRPVHAGDVEYIAMHPIDVVRDVTRPASEQRVWITRRWENKWDLAAEFPALKDKILAAPTKLEDGQRRHLVLDLSGWAKRDESEDVAVWDVYVLPSPAVPEGRLASMVTEECVLSDEPMPHRQSPIYRAAAKELEGTAFGYSMLWDLLAPQMAENHLLSTIVSTAKTLGMPTVWQPEGKGLVSYKVSGLNILKGGTTKPEPLDLLNLPPELFRLVEMFGTAMERISGVNAVFRGQAADGQKGLSGAAYALFAARAVEFASRFQGAYNKFLEDIATGTIYDYQDLGRGEYLITIAGEGNAYRVDSFTADKIDRIGRVTLKLANPMQATTAGKQSILETLLKIPGAITTPEQAIQVLSTGRLEPATKATQRELENVAKENERIAKGEQVSALITDRHWLHIPEHASVGASPEARENPVVMQAIGAHIEEHAALLRQVDPVVLTMQGCPPEVLQALTASMAPPPQPGATGGTPPPQPGETSATGPGPLMPGADAAGVPVPNQPQLPQDPRTGERMAPPQMP